MPEVSISIDRGDLKALVDMLMHEHFSYTAEGQAASRAFGRLWDALIDAKEKA